MPIPERGFDVRGRGGIHRGMGAQILGRERNVVEKGDVVGRAIRRFETRLLDRNCFRSETNLNLRRISR